MAERGTYHINPALIERAEESQEYENISSSRLFAMSPLTPGIKRGAMLCDLPLPFSYLPGTISSVSLSGGNGLLKRNPCISSQPLSLRNESCSSISTPSAITSN